MLLKTWDIQHLSHKLCYWQPCRNIFEPMLTGEFNLFLFRLRAGSFSISWLTETCWEINEMSPVSILSNLCCGCLEQGGLSSSKLFFGQCSNIWWPFDVFLKRCWFVLSISHHYRLCCVVLCPDHCPTGSLAWNQVNYRHRCISSKVQEMDCLVGVFITFICSVPTDTCSVQSCWLWIAHTGAFPRSCIHYCHWCTSNGDSLLYT